MFSFSPNKFLQIRTRFQKNQLFALEKNKLDSDQLITIV